VNWHLQDAKNSFSKLVRLARTEGPQTVTLRGERTAVVLSAKDYDALLARRPSIVDHLLSGPPWDDELVEAINTRSKYPERTHDF
jgi:prevent-host-death family protein